MTRFTEYVIRNTPCPWCGARPGDHCTSRTGRRASFTHADRYKPARDAYWAGYEDGARDAYAAYLANPEEFAKLARAWLDEGAA